MVGTCWNISTSKGQKLGSESIGIRLWTLGSLGSSAQARYQIQSPPVIPTDPLKGPSRASEAPRKSRIQRGSYQGLCKNDRTSWWPEARRQTKLRLGCFDAWFWIFWRCWSYESALTFVGWPMLTIPRFLGRLEKTPWFFVLPKMSW
jgi:hypothetical protein